MEYYITEYPVHPSLGAKQHFYVGTPRMVDKTVLFSFLLALHTVYHFPLPWGRAIGNF
jgi:hypothetical protein